MTSTAESERALSYHSSGGLLVDLGVLTLKSGALPESFYPDAKSGIPRLPPSHPAIVEWRAMTVIQLCVFYSLLDRCKH